MNDKWAILGPSLVIVAMSLLLVNPVYPWWMQLLAFCLLVACIIQINYRYFKMIKKVDTPTP